MKETKLTLFPGNVFVFIHSLVRKVGLPDSVRLSKYNIDFVEIKSNSKNKICAVNYVKMGSKNKNYLALAFAD